MSATKRPECNCDKCQQACQRVPGWFRPGEAEKAAALLGLSLPAFFKRYLGVQWWEAERPTFVLAPAIVDRMEPGHEYPSNPRGQCVFFEEGRCAIHAAKPHDCAFTNPCLPQTDERAAMLTRDRARTVTLWKRQQGQIRELLGRKPRAAAWSPLEALFW